MYTDEDCSYFSFVLIPLNEIWWIPYNLFKGKRSVSTNIEADSWANIEATQTDKKSGIKFLNFIKTLQIKAKA